MSSSSQTISNSCQDGDDDSNYLKLAYENYLNQAIANNSNNKRNGPNADKKDKGLLYRDDLGAYLLNRYREEQTMLALNGQAASLDDENGQQTKNGSTKDSSSSKDQYSFPYDKARDGLIGTSASSVKRVKQEFDSNINSNVKDYDNIETQCSPIPNVGGTKRGHLISADLNDYDATAGHRSAITEPQPQYYNFLNNKEFFIDAVKNKDSRLTYVRKQGPNLKSIIWTTFSVIYFEGEITNFVKCDRCDHVYKYDRRTTGTSTLNRHPCIRYVVLGVAAQQAVLANAASSEENSSHDKDCGIPVENCYGDKVPYLSPNSEEAKRENLGLHGAVDMAPGSSLSNDDSAGSINEKNNGFPDNHENFQPLFGKIKKEFVGQPDTPAGKSKDANAQSTSEALLQLRNNMLFTAAQENDLPPTMVPLNPNSQHYYLKSSVPHTSSGSNSSTSCNKLITGNGRSGNGYHIKTALVNRSSNNVSHGPPDDGKIFKNNNSDVTRGQLTSYSGYSLAENGTGGLDVPELTSSNTSSIIANYLNCVKGISYDDKSQFGQNTKQRPIANQLMRDENGDIMQNGNDVSAEDIEQSDSIRPNNTMPDKNESNRRNTNLSNGYSTSVLNAILKPSGVSADTNSSGCGPQSYLELFKSLRAAASAQSVDDYYKTYYKSAVGTRIACPKVSSNNGSSVKNNTKIPPAADLGNNGFSTVKHYPMNQQNSSAFENYHNGQCHPNEKLISKVSTVLYNHLNSGALNTEKSLSKDHLNTNYTAEKMNGFPELVDDKHNLSLHDDDQCSKFWDKIGKMGLLDDFVDEIKMGLDELKRCLMRELVMANNNIPQDSVMHTYQSPPIVYYAKKLSGIVNELNLMNKFKCKLAQHQREIIHAREKINREMNDLKRKLEVQEKQQLELHKRSKYFDELIDGGFELSLQQTATSSLPNAFHRSTSPPSTFSSRRQSSDTQAPAGNAGRKLSVPNYTDTESYYKLVKTAYRTDGATLNKVTNNTNGLIPINDDFNNKCTDSSFVLDDKLSTYGEECIEQSTCEEPTLAAPTAFLANEINRDLKKHKPDISSLIVTNNHNFAEYDGDNINPHGLVAQSEGSECDSNVRYRECSVDPPIPRLKISINRNNGLGSTTTIHGQSSPNYAEKEMLVKKANSQSEDGTLMQDSSDGTDNVYSRSINDEVSNAYQSVINVVDHMPAQISRNFPTSFGSLSAVPASTLESVNETKSQRLLNIVDKFGILNGIDSQGGPVPSLTQSNILYDNTNRQTTPVVHDINHQTSANLKDKEDQHNYHLNQDAEVIIPNEEDDDLNTPPSTDEGEKLLSPGTRVSSVNSDNTVSSLPTTNSLSCMSETISSGTNSGSEENLFLSAVVTTETSVVNKLLLDSNATTKNNLAALSPQCVT